MTPEERFIENLIDLIDKHDQVHVDIPYIEDLVPELDSDQLKIIVASLEKAGYIKKSKVEHQSGIYYAVSYKHDPLKGLRMFAVEKENAPKKESSSNKDKISSIKEEFFISEEDINKMAENAVQAIKEKDIIKLFDILCLPFNDGNGYKEKLFLQIYKLLGIDASYEKGIGVVVPAKKDKKRVVVSHMDLIPSFNKGFKDSKKYAIEENKLIGALDNTITNAVAMIVSYHTSSEDTEFVFTEGEETGFFGMKEYMKQKHFDDLFYINMDVTNDSWKYNASIEYDEPCWEICCQINKNIEAGFTKDRVCDDLDVVVDNNGYGLSYCLPTKKTIHSWNNYTLIEKLEPYLNGLFFLVESLDLSIKDKNIKEISISKALKCSTKEELEKKEKKAKKRKEKKRKKWASSFKSSYKASRNYSYEDLGMVHSYSTDSHGQRYFDFGAGLIEEDNLQGFGETPPDSYIEEYDNSDFISEDYVSQVDIMNLEYVVKDAIDVLEHNGVTVDKYLAGFIHEKTFEQTQWSKDELAGHIGDLNKAEEVILILDDNYLLKTIEPGTIFMFPSRSEYSI